MKQILLILVLIFSLNIPTASATESFCSSIPTFDANGIYEGCVLQIPGLSYSTFIFNNGLIDDLDEQHMCADTCPNFLALTDEVKAWLGKEYKKLLAGFCADIANRCKKSLFPIDELDDAS